MREESSSFKNALAQFTELKHHYKVVECGVGKVDAAQTTALEVFGSTRVYDLVVVIGYAGASPYFHQGDIIIPDRCQAHDVHVPEAFSYLRPVYNLEGSDECICLTGDTFVDDKLSKELTSRFGDKWICDMESAAVAQVLSDSDIPMLVIKMVSDIPENGDPLAFTQFVETHKDFIPFLAFLEQLD